MAQGVERLHSGHSRRALLTLLLTGLRAQEALKLDWRNVEEDRRRLTIADSKTGGFVKIICSRLAEGVSCVVEVVHGRVCRKAVVAQNASDPDDLMTAVADELCLRFDPGFPSRTDPA